jgi:hypothetical protein
LGFHRLLTSGTAAIVCGGKSSRLARHKAGGRYAEEFLFSAGESLGCGWVALGATMADDMLQAYRGLELHPNTFVGKHVHEKQYCTVPRGNSQFKQG